MIDLHHDLLSILYYSYIRNDFSFVTNWIKNFHGDNVSGLLANLYFMNLDEMEKELGRRDFDVVEMFKTSVSLFHQYLPNTKVLFSIEGCDYIDSTSQLEELYNLGLRNILLVWNNPNKYGSGNRGRYGLTEDGREFLRKAINLGISLDLSHMNRQTFFDTIDFIKEEIKNGKKPKVIASHSNCYSVYQHLRNLDDEQLKALKSVDGLLGIVGYGAFIGNKRDSSDLKDLFLEHIRHAVSIMGIDSVGISTDDMTFSKELFFENFWEMVFDYSNVKIDLEDLLSKKFSRDEIEKILYLNSYNKLFEEKKMRIVKPGEKYRHFKDHIISVIAIAKDSEDLHKVVVYDYDGEIWVRPYDMFVSEVDHEKYPEIKQKYRFEKIKGEK